MPNILNEDYRSYVLCKTCQNYVCENFIHVAEFYLREKSNSTFSVARE